MIKFDPRKDYYAVFGVVPTADRDTIRARYYGLAKILHTDKTGNTPENRTRFSEIAEAYAVLSREDVKKKYDEARKSKPRKPIKQNPKQQRDLETIANAAFAVTNLGISYEDFSKAYDAFTFIMEYERYHAMLKRSRERGEPATVGQSDHLKRMSKRVPQEIETISKVAKRNYTKPEKLFAMLLDFRKAESIADKYFIDIKETIWLPL